MLTRVLVCTAMAGARLGELGWSRRNLARSGLAVEGRWSRRTYPGIVVLHASVMAATALRGRGRGMPLLLALLLAAQVVRGWVLVTLGSRWNARGAVPLRMHVATNGPYRFVRHPNYAVVGVELIALPAAFGLWGLAAAASVANGALIAIRLRDEEEALMAIPGYRDHFDRLPRFVPRFRFRARTRELLGRAGAAPGTVLHRH